MTKRMLIDAAHAEETRVVVLDGQRIDELDFERQSRKQLRGNIYLAKVTRVEPSLQAAFVEYGGNRHGFLAFNEIHPDYYQIPVADREALLREEAEDEAEHHRRHNGRGHAQETNGEEAVSASDDEDDIMEEELERRRRRLMRRYKIQEVIKRRQIMLIQVVKEERGNKGAALTTYLSLAGRYCVLMPNTARGGGISRKITNAVDRKRLKSAVQSLEVPQGMGLIIRTAGAARTKAEIKRDYEYLLRLWEAIREKTLQSIAPALIYEEEDLVKRAIRDMYDKDIDAVLVEGDGAYREARDFMRMLMPSQAKKVQQHREPAPLFLKYKIEDQLQQIHSPVVPLRSGGYLVINQTEALVAIDVNSGKSTRERNIEATALKTNMEAAEEAARQLRLRDLAGLIVIDFIDMDEAKNNRAVEKKLKDCLKDDRARLQMGKISAFGLMEISRQRRRMGVLEGATHVCEHCQGVGRVQSVESSALSALRSIEIEAVRGGPGGLVARLPTAVGLYVLNEKRAYLGRIEQTHSLTLTIATDDALSNADIEIERTAGDEVRERVAEAPAYSPPALPAFEAVDDDVSEDEEVEEAVAEENEAAETAVEGEGRRGRGRRRRRGRGRRDEAGFERGQDGGERSTSPEASDAEAGEEDDHEQGGEAFVGESSEEAAQRRRRRRRGRRGGRRMREEGRPHDTYGWTDAQGQFVDGEDPYVWRDPHEASHAQPAAEQAQPQPEPEAEVEAAPPTAAEAEAAPAAEEAPARTRARRPRGGRGRARAAAEAVEGVATQEPAEEVGVSVPEAATGATDPEPAATEAPAEPSAEATQPEAQAAPEPAEAPAPEAAPEPAPILESANDSPPPAPEPDPAEITGQPAAPKRGWWRRKG